MKSASQEGWMQRKSAILTLVFLPLSACMTRAPTTYELDRRAGMLPPAGEGVVQDLSLIKTNSKIASVPTMPMKIPALIEKVWLSDVTLTDGVKMQGTWLFLEVEPGKWLDEVDPGAAPLVFPKSAIVK